MSKGLLIVLSGPSGVGKSTIIDKVCKKLERKPFFSVSYTTRTRRPAEQDGVNYHFVSHETFRQMIADKQLLEHCSYAGNYYGTPALPVRERLERGEDVLLDVEVRGALQVRQNYPDAVLIFVAAPSFAELEHRLRARGDTDEASIRLRLETARTEYAQARQYDYLVCNDNVHRCADQIYSILCAERCRVKNNDALLKEALDYVISPDVGTSEAD